LGKIKKGPRDLLEVVCRRRLNKIWCNLSACKIWQF